MQDIDNTDKYYDVTKLADSADGCLMVEVHYYSPWNFAGMEKDESWGKMSWYWGSANHVGGSAYNSTWGEESYLLAQFKKMKAKFVDKGYPVILGEYGCQWRDLSGKAGEDQAKHDASVKAFHRQVNEQAVNLGLVPMVWDINYTNRQGTKGTMTIIDRKQLGIFNQHAIDGITEGVAAATWGGTPTSLQRVPFRQAPESAYSLSGYRVGSDYQGVVVSGGRKYIRPLFY
jgi:hypothetical protein